MNCNSELEVEDRLEKFFKDNGYEVKRQVESFEKYPDGRPKGIADMIIYSAKLGVLNPIGIEIKFMRGIQKGGIISEGINQCLRYRKLTFNGRQIKCWIIGIYFRNVSFDEFYKQAHRTTDTLCYGLCGGFGIAYMPLNQLDFPSNKIQASLTTGMNTPLTLYFGNGNLPHERIEKTDHGAILDKIIESQRELSK